jgi:hypothetical protein
VCLFSANYDHTIRPDIFKPKAFFPSIFLVKRKQRTFFRDD